MSASLSLLSCTESITITSIFAPSELNFMIGLAERHSTGFIPGQTISSMLITYNASHCSNQSGDALYEGQVEYSISGLPTWMYDLSDNEDFWITFQDGPNVTIPDDVLDPILVTLNCVLIGNSSLYATREDVMLNDKDLDNLTDYYEYLHAALLLSNQGSVYLTPNQISDQIGATNFFKVPTALISSDKGLDFNTEESSSDIDNDGESNEAEFTAGTNPFVASSGGVLSAGESFVSLGVPEDLVSADFDGDGDLDIAHVGLSGGQLALYFNDGTASFSNKTDYSIDTGAWGIVAVDLDNDDDYDLVTANYTSNTMSVLLNDGTGTFGSATSVSAPGAPIQLVAGDFNGDGNMDIAAPNFGASSDGTTISIYEGDGSGALSLARNLTSNTGPHHVLTADFNKDNALDLAVTNRGSNGDGTTIQIYLGNGDGTFQDPDNLTTDDGPAGIVVADFDGDLNLDLAVANNRRDDGSTVSIFMGNGDGSFDDASSLSTNAGPYDLLAFDIDGDSDVDLIVSDAIGKAQIFLNDGEGSLSAGQELNIGTATYNNFMAPGDFDGDGDIDFVNSDFAGMVLRVFLNE